MGHMQHEHVPAFPACPACLQEERRRLQEERRRSDALLYQMIPPHVADLLRCGERAPAESHDEVTILFSGGHRGGVDGVEGVCVSVCVCVGGGEVSKVRVWVWVWVWPGVGAPGEGLHGGPGLRLPAALQVGLGWPSSCRGMVFSCCELA